MLRHNLAVAYAVYVARTMGAIALYWAVWRLRCDERLPYSAEWEE